MRHYLKWLALSMVAMFWLTGNQAVNAAQNTGFLRIYNYDSYGYSFHADLSNGKKLLMSEGHSSEPLSTYIPAGGSATMVLRDGHYRLLLLGTPSSVRFKVRDDRHSAIKIRRGGPSGRDLLAEVSYRGHLRGVYPLQIIPVIVRPAPVIVRSAPVIIQQAPIIVHQPAPVYSYQPHSTIIYGGHGAVIINRPAPVIVRQPAPVVVYQPAPVVVMQHPVYESPVVIYPHRRTVAVQPYGGRHISSYSYPTHYNQPHYNQPHYNLPHYNSSHYNSSHYRRPRHNNGMAILFNLAFGHR